MVVPIAYRELLAGGEEVSAFIVTLAYSGCGVGRVSSFYGTHLTMAAHISHVTEASSIARLSNGT